MPAVIENLWQRVLPSVECFTCHEPNLTFPPSEFKFSHYFISLFLCLCMSLYEEQSGHAI